MDELAISPEELAKVIGMEGSLEIPAQPKTSPGTDSFPKTKTQPSPPVATARPVQFAPLEAPSSVTPATNLDLLLGVTLRVTVELGRTKMNIEEILNLGPGSVVELDKLAGEPVDVLINDRMIARGEVVVLDDRFGVRVTDVLSPPSNESIH